MHGQKELDEALGLEGKLRKTNNQDKDKPRTYRIFCDPPHYYSGKAGWKARRQG